MKTRMQPIDHLWSKLPRVVRDLGAACGKQVRLEMVGRDTELDRTLLEAVKDPLTHLVRNAVDHGLEAPERRVAAGKAVEGTLTLRAFHEGGQVVVEVTDDGAGIDPEKIRAIIREGLQELGLKPFGKTLVKPNLVAAGPLFPYAFTRPEFGEGVLRALQDVGGDGMEELAAGERCGITVPSRVAFRESGWDDMLERVKVKKYHFEEQQQVEIPLTHEGRLRDYVFTPEPIARADFFVNCPKFKAHPWTTVTFSMKNYIGIQDDRHRLIDHDHKLNEKIADLQHIIQPQFIAIDAIFGHGDS